MVSLDKYFMIIVQIYHAKCGHALGLIVFGVAISKLQAEKLCIIIQDI